VYEGVEGPSSGGRPPRFLYVNAESAYVIAVDIGGTFTDLVACDLDTGAAAYTKSPTTYGRLGEAVFDCIRKAALDARDATFVKHGTTLVINALLQRNGSKTALLTTKGFRDILEIGRGNRTQPFNLRFRREQPLIPRELRFEIEERIDGAGKVRTPLSTMALGEIAASLRAHEVEALAISFLNAYLDPAHEQAAAAELRRLLPDVFVTTGSELTREWHEFERTATAAAIRRARACHLLLRTDRDWLLDVVRFVKRTRRTR